VRKVDALLRRAIAHIADYPEAAQRVEQRRKLRRLPLAPYPYVIFYEVGADRVTILHILHAARRSPL
jgi:plasmid stabilization system protein ParE